MLPEYKKVYVCDDIVKVIGIEQEEDNSELVGFYPMFRII